LICSFVGLWAFGLKVSYLNKCSWNKFSISIIIDFPILLLLIYDFLSFMIAIEGIAFNTLNS